MVISGIRKYIQSMPDYRYRLLGFLHGFRELTMACF